MTHTSRRRRLRPRRTAARSSIVAHKRGDTARTRSSRNRASSSSGSLLQTIKSWFWSSKPSEDARVESADAPEARSAATAERDESVHAAAPRDRATRGAVRHIHGESDDEAEAISDVFTPPFHPSDSECSSAVEATRLVRKRLKLDDTQKRARRRRLRRRIAARREHDAASDDETHVARLRRRGSADARGDAAAAGADEGDAAMASDASGEVDLMLFAPEGALGDDESNEDMLAAAASEVGDGEADDESAAHEAREDANDIAESGEESGEEDEASGGESEEESSEEEEEEEEEEADEEEGESGESGEGGDVSSLVTYAEDEEEFDPYLFMAQLPPLPVELKKEPCMPPKAPDDERITLVLDLDETLVHTSTVPIEAPHYSFDVQYRGINHPVYVRQRPHFRRFIEAVAKVFEVVVFTASQPEYADKLLDLIDPEGTLFHHRLFRDSCVYVQGNFVKDLTVLNRDLARTVIIDNSPHAFAYQVENGIPITTWFDNEHDVELVHMLRVLRRVRNADDVRTVLSKEYGLMSLLAEYRKLIANMREDVGGEDMLVTNLF